MSDNPGPNNPGPQPPQPDPAPSPGAMQQLQAAGGGALQYGGAPALAYYAVGTINDLVGHFTGTHISGNGMGLLWIVITALLSYLYAHNKELEMIITQAEHTYHVDNLHHTYVIGHTKGERGSSTEEVEEEQPV